MAHLDLDTIHRASLGLLPPAARSSVDAHVEECASCRQLLIEATRLNESARDAALTQSSEPAPTSSLTPGTSIGRYLVLSPLGRGASSEVHVAYDPSLDRKVALKVMTLGNRPPERALAEARLVAQLKHPDIIDVFDVGVSGDHVYAAMELALHGSARTWASAAPRPWRRVISIYRDAALGLIHAHRQGVLHLDVKPDNVLVLGGERGVMGDFGLARHVAGVSQGLGTPIGTPAYIAPEQYRGEGVDARSDQFSFCAALWETLAGARTFAGTSKPEVMRAIVSGERRTFPEGTGVPKAVVRALERGLSSNPADRFPDMEALLERLLTDPAATRRRWAARAGLVLALVTAVAGVAEWNRRSSAICKGGGPKMAAVWSDGSRQAVARAFDATGAPYAQDAFRTVAHELDTRAAGWVRAHTEACEATRVSKEQNEDMLALRMACLDDRLRELNAVVQLFGAADTEVVKRAAQTSSSLESARLCSDTAALAAVVRLPSEPARRAQVEALKVKLSTARARLLGGKFREGLELVKPLGEEAAALGYAPVLAEVRLLEGELWRDAGELEKSERALLEALYGAEASRHDDVVARAAITLAAVVGVRLGRYEAGEQWGRLAESVLARQQGSDELTGALWSALGSMADARGDYAEAVKRYRRSLAARERAFGRDSPVVGFALNNLGVTLMNMGQLPAAREALERAMALQTAGLGRSHPQLVYPLQNLGTLEVREGNLERGLALHQEAYALALKMVGPNHPQVGQALGNLAQTALQLKQHAEAADFATRALAIYDARFPDGHPMTVYMLTTLGQAELALDRKAEAVAALEKALQRLERNTLPPEVGALTRFQLARALAAAGKAPPRVKQLATSARDALPKGTDAALEADLDAFIAALR